jgi:hypothetical protein
MRQRHRVEVGAKAVEHADHRGRRPPPWTANAAANATADAAATTIATVTTATTTATIIDVLAFAGGTSAAAPVFAVAAGTIATDAVPASATEVVVVAAAAATTAAAAEHTQQSAAAPSQVARPVEGDGVAAQVCSHCRHWLLLLTSRAV